MKEEDENILRLFAYILIISIHGIILTMKTQEDHWQTSGCSLMESGCSKFSTGKIKNKIDRQIAYLFLLQKSSISNEFYHSIFWGNKRKDAIRHKST